MPTSEPRFPARFDPGSWGEDLTHTTPTGRSTTEAARSEYESSGIPRSHLRPCDEHARDGTHLPQCFKVYLPQPAGRFGMVFTVDREARNRGRLALVYLAFGVRHHPRSSHAPTVYKIAHDRLHADEEPDIAEA